MNAKYVSIGINYTELRISDPRIARLIENALGPARNVLNVGAGTDSYEPKDRHVTAIEPSIEMIRKRAMVFHKLRLTRFLRAQPNEQSCAYLFSR